MSTAEGAGDVPAPTPEGKQPEDKQKLPRQIPFIIGNEICERFSFYGMRNILTAFLIDYLLLNEIPDKELREGVAKENFHLFVSAVYFFPLLGGMLADRFLGKYRTILYLSLFYCAGHACLAAFESSKVGFYAGLFLIAFGSGGIKPCVSSMVGNQLNEKSKHLASKVFAVFYFSINFGSFFASLLIPKTLKIWGPAVAFGIPGVLMFLATVIFWLGRRFYVVVPPTGANPHSFLRVLKTAFTQRQAKPAEDRAPAPVAARPHWLDAALGVHPKEAVEGAKAVLRLLVVLLPIPFFWMLFDQKASTWVVQAKKMDRTIGPITFEPSQMQFVNPALVMILIPLCTLFLYPTAKRLGFELTPLRRMAIGMFIGALSYVAAGLIDIPVSRGHTVSILWQLLPYVLLTTAEVFVSVTGLEFAYSQAPTHMKGTIMSIWSLTVTAGNLAVALASGLNVFRGPVLFFYYAAFAALAALALALIGRRYVVVDYYRKRTEGSA